MCTFALAAKIHHVANSEVVVVMPDKDGRFMNADNARLTTAGTEGIVKTQNSDFNTKPCYDLQGRRIQAPLKRGVYILNGRKYIVG